MARLRSITTLLFPVTLPLLPLLPTAPLLLAPLLPPQSALKLCALLKKRCVQGPDGVGQRTDIHLELGRMTLQV